MCFRSVRNATKQIDSCALVPLNDVSVSFFFAVHLIPTALVMLLLKLLISFALFLDFGSASTDYSCLHSDSWLLNRNSETNSYFSSTTEVSSSSRSSDTWSTTTKQIPKYNKLFSASDISALNSRPKASTDFITGSTTAVAGSAYQFGANIGYKTQSCSKGYWPPGPSCPSATTVTDSWDLTPSPETNSDGCYFPHLGKIGSWVNGVAIFGTSDGLSYNSQNNWNNLAPEFEVYDLDGISPSPPLHLHAQATLLPLL
jgi:hypothetical protein